MIIYIVILILTPNYYGHFAQYFPANLTYYIVVHLDIPDHFRVFHLRTMPYDTCIPARRLLYLLQGDITGISLQLGVPRRFVMRVIEGGLDENTSTYDGIAHVTVADDENPNGPKCTLYLFGGAFLALAHDLRDYLLRPHSDVRVKLRFV